MNILKFKKDANECTWVAADKIEFIDVVGLTTVDVRMLGTLENTAMDEVVITTASGKSAEVAAELARYIHDKGKKSGVVDVAAISGVASIAALAVDA